MNAHQWARQLAYQELLVLAKANKWGIAETRNEPDGDTFSIKITDVEESSYKRSFQRVEHYFNSKKVSKKYFLEKFEEQ